MTTSEDRFHELERELLHDRFIDFERSVLQDNIVLCDAKAGLLLAFSGAMVIFCIDAFIHAHGEGGAHPTTVSVITQALLAVSAIGFLASAQMSLNTVLPRMVRGHVDHIFWESPVFKLSLDEYVSTMEQLDIAIERRDKLGHLHLMAGICRRKFSQFRGAMHLAQVGFAALVLSQLWHMVF